MADGKRKTDGKDEEHFCERSFCLMHDTHKEELVELSKGQKERPEWKYYGILLLAIVGSYSYTFYTNNMLVQNQIQSNITIATNSQRLTGIESDTEEIKRSMREDISAIRIMLGDRNRR